MSTIAITGSASGIGAATRDLLESDSVNVIGVDLHNAEIEVDLSIESERSRAISEILRSVSYTHLTLPTILLV